MKTFADLTDVSGKRVFVRADFNVPIVNGKIGDDFRIKKSFSTINTLRELGAKIILASHIESGEGTLRPVYEYLKDVYPLSFVRDYFPEQPDISSDIVLLENLRQYPEEKQNDIGFARHLAGFADIYVNEAFPAAHRSHASIVGIPKYIPSFAGVVFEEEVRELSRALSPEHPLLFILGGAKFDTKLPLVKKFFTISDTIFIGGALANDFFKAKGIPTGKSLLSEGEFQLEQFLSDKLILPEDVVVSNEEKSGTKHPADILPDESISDVGPHSIDALRPFIQNAKYILWNGPLGNYEKGFKEATLSLAELIAESKAFSIVGGGDTVASIAELNLWNRFGFISTGGGAMLEFLANETLPGIEALS